MYVGGLKLPVATSTTPPRVPPSLPHQINRESDDSRVHPSRDLNKQRPDFCYLLSSMDSLSLGRGTTSPTSSIAGQRVAGGEGGFLSADCLKAGLRVGDRGRGWGSGRRGGSRGLGRGSGRGAGMGTGSGGETMGRRRP